MNYKLTRGWRNNNPLNIIHSKSEWQGKSPVQTDKRFVQFVSRAYGYRAAIKTLQSYYNTARTAGTVFNLEFIIHRWCPDGKEQNYINTVVKHSALDQKTALPEPRTREAMPTFVKIMAGMTVQECGVPIKEMPWQDIEKGYSLANKIIKN